MIPLEYAHADVGDSQHLSGSSLHYGPTSDTFQNGLVLPTQKASYSLAVGPLELGSMQKVTYVSINYAIDIVSTEHQVGNAKRLSSRILELAQLSDGWAGGRSKRISRAAIEAADSLASQLDSLDVLADRIVPDVEGGLSFYFVPHGAGSTSTVKFARLSVSSDGELVASMHAANGSIEKLYPVSEDSEIGEALRDCRAFVGG